MKTICFSLLVLLGLIAATTLPAQVPQFMAYQGRITESGVNVSGPTGQFKFALVNSTGTASFWSHDDTSRNGSEPTNNFVTLPIEDGLFSVLLGDATIPNMMGIPQTTFGVANVRLRIWFRKNASEPTFQLLSPDQKIGAAPYAMMSYSVINSSITSNKLADATISGAKLADGSVTSAKILDGTITAADLAAGVLGTTNIADGSITGGKLANLTITGGKIADGAVDTAKILDGTIVAADLATGAVATVRIADSAVTTAKLANNAVTAAKIIDSSITTSKLADGVVTAAKIAQGVLATLGQTTTNLSLGTCTNCSSIHVQGTDFCTPAITLDGCSSQISAFVQSNGVEAVEIAATGNGGLMTLRNATGSSRLVGGSTGDRGYLNLFAGSAPVNLVSVALDAEDANGGGSLFLSTPILGPFLTRNSLTLKGQNAQGVPEFAMDLPAGVLFGSPRRTVQVTGDGKLLLNRTSGTNTVEINGGTSGSQGGTMWLRNAAGNDSILLDAEDGNGRGGVISIRNRNGVETIEIDGDRGDTSARGYIALRKNDGSSTIILDADDSGAGRITTDILQINGADFSEKFDIKPIHDELQPGMIVCIDPDNPGQLVTSSKAYDTTVAGIISGAGGVRTGMLMGHPGTLADGQHPVALSGRVYCMVDADQGAIRPGDLITTSNTPGHGMKVNDPAKAHGAIIGKAMTRLEKGKGLVLVLVSLQ